MSLADALNPHISEHVPLDDAYPALDAHQPASIDQDEEMDDLFDEDAVVDQAERSSIPPSSPVSQPIHWPYVGTLSQKRVRIGWRAGRRDF